MNTQLLFMFLVILTAASAAFPDESVCGLVKDEPRIIGGEVADIGEFPWIVGIEYKSKRIGENAGLRCVGSLINNRFVLTAANCLLDREFEPISVWLGEWRISTDPDCKELVANVECTDPVQKIPIKELIPHMYYSRKSRSHNIGLILLENEIQFTNYISPICLPLPTLPSPEPGTRMTVAGWGVTENGSTSDVLRKVKVPLISNEECNEKLKQTIKISSQHLCAGSEEGKDSCQGDTGGPLMRIIEDKQSGSMQWYQEGLVSFGIGCGRVGYPATYTRVSSYIDWIINIISEPED